jgi:ATP-dependent DNA helicase RecQ
MNWPTIVFSPLQALMRDQVRSLQERGIQAGRISGDQVDSLNDINLELWMRGELQFIYVAPERLTNDKFKHAMKIRPPMHMVVDEAHCLSQWSQTFRAHYMMLGDFAREMNPQVISAFTATCPPEAEGHIRGVLGLANAERMCYYSRRDNLVLSSDEYPGDGQFADFVLNQTDGLTLVYATSIKRVEELAELLAERGGAKISTFYHGKLSDAAKATNMNKFMTGAARICVATNAFGMGIDISAIRWVVHRDLPGTPEALSQEIGRAGRDGEISYCRIFFDQRSVRTQEYFIDMACPEEDTVRSVFNVIRHRADLNNGVCTLNNKDLASACGFEKDRKASDQISTILTLLTANQIITKGSEKDTCASVEFLEAPSVTRLFQEQRDAIYDIGIPVGNLIEFDIEDLADRMGVPDTTIKSRMTQWQGAGLLRYYPPANLRPLRVVGDIEALPWGEISSRRADSYRKLHCVVRYCNTDDDKKHAFLESAMAGG